ncbi:MAG: hypothetical protein EXQ52_05655 [Bryobacterales bacterium]|nr:hypothetical protein [Bryobacterales bacterium]
MRRTALLIACFASSAFGADYPVLRTLHPFPGSRFFLPNDQDQHTSVVMLHGSEGGSVPYIESEATILASQGFAVLTLCYFDCNRGLVGPRKTLRDVEATLVLRAASWLRGQPHSNGKVAVYGFSRGAELALIVGSLTATAAERPTALIAHSPSDIYNSFYNWSWQEPSCWVCRNGLGRCPTNAPRSELAWNPACGPDDETRMDFSQSAWLIHGANVPRGVRIRIEDFDGPILITVGERDTVWSPDQTRRIEATLRDWGRNPEVHYFPEGGHVFGGDDENRRRAHVLRFLRALP